LPSVCETSKTYTAQAVQLRLRVFLLSVLPCDLFYGFAFPPDHGSDNENPLLATADEAAQRVPGTDSGHVRRRRFLSSDERDVAEAVGMELGHGREVLGQHFTVANLPRLDEVNGCFLGLVLDSF